MKHAIHPIWDVPAYLPHIQPELSDEAVLAVENLIGYKLPFEYLELLKAQNGGGIRWTLPDQVHNSIRGIGPHYPALEPCDWTAYGEWLPMSADDAKKLVPFDGDGHWMLCFDYREQNPSPSITLVDTESVSEESIAGSFAEYLVLLEPDVNESTLVLSEIPEIAGFLSKLATALGMEIDSHSDWGYGYPSYRLLREGKEFPQCVWLSPNLVPRGYVREEDPRYAELKDLLPGMLKRYPGVPEAGWLLDASEAILPELIAFLESNGIAPVYLTDCHGLSLFGDA